MQAIGTQRTTAAPTGAPETFEQATSILAQIGFVCLTLFLVLSYSRLIDAVSVPNVLLVLAALTALFALFNGTLHRSLVSVPGLLLVALTGWMCLSMPFSLWRGGSFQFLTEHWIKSVSVFFLIAGTISTYEQCRKAVLALAVACVVLMVIVLYSGTAGQERLALTHGTLANANDLALYLLLGLPFCLFALMTRPQLSPIRVVLLVVMVTIVILSLRTGSRSGLLTLAAGCGAVFWKASFINKAKLATVATLTLVLATALVPQTILERLHIFGGDALQSENIEVRRASGSFNARMRLLNDAIYLTKQHPVLGVGPGMFMVGTEWIANEEGLPEQWQVAHNSYLEVASESGLPALLIYLAIIVYCAKTCLDVRNSSRDNPAQRELRTMASCLFLGTLMYGVAGLFGSLSYGIFLPTLAGLTETMRRSTELWRKAPASGLTQPTPSDALRRSRPRIGVLPAFSPRPPLR